MHDEAQSDMHVVQDLSAPFPAWPIHPDIGQLRICRDCSRSSAHTLSSLVVICQRLLTNAKSTNVLRLTYLQAAAESQASQEREAHEQSMDLSEVAHLNELAELRERFVGLQSKDTHTPEELAELDALRNQVIQYQVCYIYRHCLVVSCWPKAVCVCYAAWYCRRLPLYTKSGIAC